MALAPNGGFGVLQALKQRFPKTAVLVLAPQAHPMAVLRALLDGATAFIMKENAETELLKAIRTISKGRIFHNGTITPRLVQLLSSKEVLKSCITHAELAFLSHCCHDDKYTNIAGSLQLSNRQAKRMRESLFCKLGVGCRSGLALAAVQLGVHPFSS